MDAPLRLSVPRRVRPARTLLVFAALLATTLPAAAPLTAQRTAALTADDLAKGRMHYVASCARCHGVTGDGGEGPPLARAELPRAPDDEALISLMLLGIPGTAMGSS